MITPSRPTLPDPDYSSSRTSRRLACQPLQLFAGSLIVLLFLSTGAFAQPRLERLLGDGSALLLSPSGEVLLGINVDEPLVPASILKIPMAQVALDVLGEDFRFETHFYTNAAGDLLIRGLGDPFLVSEEIVLIADALAEQGLSTVRRLLVDDSAFEPDPDLPLELDARDPYAARVSALAVNFNTVNLAWDSGELISGEEQTPLTPLARELGASLPRGQAERINLGQNPEAGLRQVQQLFQHFLQRAGIAVQDVTGLRGAAGEGWELRYRHRSTRPLPDILAGMLRYSNNFIANQLFLTVGAQHSGYPATVSKARAVTGATLGKLYGPGFGSSESSLLMLEGSGLSRQQRLTAAAMGQVLQRFRPHAGLLPEYDGVLRKSGTLSGVYNYAGYLRGPDGLYPFVILTNQSVNYRDEVLVQLRTAL